MRGIDAKARDDDVFPLAPGTGVCELCQQQAYVIPPKPQDVAKKLEAERSATYRFRVLLLGLLITGAWCP